MMSEEDAWRAAEQAAAWARAAWADVAAAGRAGRFDDLFLGACMALCMTGLLLRAAGVDGPQGGTRSSGGVAAQARAKPTAAAAPKANSAPQSQAQSPQKATANPATPQRGAPPGSRTPLRASKSPALPTPKAAAPATPDRASRQEQARNDGEDGEAPADSHGLHGSTEYSHEQVEAQVEEHVEERRDVPDDEDNDDNNGMAEEEGHDHGEDLANVAPSEAAKGGQVVSPARSDAVPTVPRSSCTDSPARLGRAGDWEEEAKGHDERPETLSDADTLSNPEEDVGPEMHDLVSPSATATADPEADREPSRSPPSTPHVHKSSLQPKSAKKPGNVAVIDLVDAATVGPIVAPDDVFLGANFSRRLIMALRNQANLDIPSTKLSVNHFIDVLCGLPEEKIPTRIFLEVFEDIDGVIDRYMTHVAAGEYKGVQATDVQKKTLFHLVHDRLCKWCNKANKKLPNKFVYPKTE